MDIHQLIEEKQRRGEPIRIELGCGPSKKAGCIGIDSLPLEGVDYVADLEQGLAFLPDNCADEITSSHLLEHIAQFEPLMRDIHRILKPNGIQTVVVPYFSNPYYYSDHTHKRFFGLYTFDYFATATKMRRKVPSFYHQYHYEVVSRRLVFKSPHFWFRNLVKQVFNRLFNASGYMQELYEECFCYIFPCQEVHFTLRPIK
jgi:ubiquinone/menaquinone biosynthesis C-methylase UbiE